MKRTKYVLGFVIAAAIVACDRNPSTPSPLSTPEVVAIRITVAGNTRLGALGETSQLTVTVEMSNGTTQTPASTSITWNINPPGIATVSAEGLLTAVAAGETRVTAQYPTAQRRLSMSLPVFVLPDGPFILRGNVSELSFSLDGVTVEVIAGSGTGRSVTAAGGRYALYGLMGDLLVRAARAGYVAETKSVRLDSDATLDFSLRPSTPHVQLSPRYTLTVIASEACGDKLPEAVRSRTYVANVSQDSALVEVELQGASFWASPEKTHNRFRGRARGNMVEFFLSSGYYYYYGNDDIIEQLTETEYFSFSGFAQATVGPSGFTTQLAGYLSVFEGSDGPYGRTKSTGFCDARDHQFIFSRP